MSEKSDRLTLESLAIKFEPDDEWVISIECFGRLLQKLPSNGRLVKHIGQLFSLLVDSFNYGVDSLRN